jgi:hypothetical protein
LVSSWFSIKFTILQIGNQVSSAYGRYSNTFSEDSFAVDGIVPEKSTDEFQVALLCRHISLLHCRWLQPTAERNLNYFRALAQYDNVEGGGLFHDPPGEHYKEV